ncbi:MAG: type IV pilus twitching motility protein PilT [Acidobacteriota bacterium]
MKKIDRFVKPLYQAGGRRMVMAPGKTVVLTTASGDRAVTKEPLKASQIMGLLREILPPDLAETATNGKETEFRYESPAGAVLVKLSHPAGEPCLALIPAAAASTDPAQHADTASAGGGKAAASPRTPATRTSATGGAPAIESMFRRMVKLGCSDLHIGSNIKPMFRKDGDIIPIEDSVPLTPEEVQDLVYAITPPRHREMFERTHDTDFSYAVADLARFRCNLFMDRMGIGGVFRVIPADIPTAEDLGLSEAILQLCHLNKGLVVVTGPTGSGKSTTLAAMIDYINRNLNAHIITIEDPIEFVHENKKCLINQREIGNHTEGFKAALRAALREDPDIVLVGEMRDLETVAIAIETAETGHLVFGTLHTNTAPSTVDRMIDQFPSDRQAQIRTMLSDSLKGVIAQTLCRKIGGGRIAAQEILIVNSAVSNLIREGKTFQIQSIMQVGRGSGMVCLNDALLDLVRKKVVGPTEALRRAVAKTELETLLSRGGVKAATAKAT